MCLSPNQIRIFYWLCFHCLCEGKFLIKRDPTNTPTFFQFHGNCLLIFEMVYNFNQVACHNSNFLCWKPTLLRAHRLKLSWIAHIKSSQIAQSCPRRFDFAVDNYFQRRTTIRSDVQKYIFSLNRLGASSFRSSDQSNESSIESRLIICAQREFQSASRR